VAAIDGTLAHGVILAATHANKNMPHSPDCKKTPVASCFGRHLFICKKHTSQCYTKFNPCQLCEAEECRRAKAERKEAAETKARQEEQKTQLKEEARRKMDRKMRWTDTQKDGRLTAMHAKSG
jgi:hypothetical protein